MTAISEIRTHWQPAGPWCALSPDEIRDDILQLWKACGAPGDASDAVAAFRAVVAVECDEATARDYLRGYGAWEEHELTDHEKNLDRLVWLAGCDLNEGNEIYFERTPA